MLLRAMLAAGAAIAALSGAAQAADLVVNGNFEAGNVGFASGYAFGDVHFGGASGSYNTETSPAAAPGAWGDWMSFGDHTTGAGLMMVLNGPDFATNVPAWSQTFSVVPGADYAFNFWSASLAFAMPVPAQIQAYVNGAPVGSLLTLPTVGGQWVSSGGTWNAGDATRATFTLVDQVGVEQWNDFVLDDISFVGAPGQPIPEPAVWAMMLIGFGAVGAAVRARRRRLAPGTVELA